MTEDNDILERLKHPELEKQRHKPDNNLFVRNILNSVFMLMAAIAMIGLVITWSNDTRPVWCYMLGMLAVIVKMIEAMLRMPGLLKRTPQSRRPHTAPTTATDGTPAKEDTPAPVGTDSTDVTSDGSGQSQKQS